jgi:hypothetical protein
VDHYINGVLLRVVSSNIRTPVSFQAGVAVHVDPKTFLGFIVGHKQNAGSISGTVRFRGGEYDEATESCRDCSKLTLRARTHWGFLPGNPFGRADYDVHVSVGGAEDDLSGSILYKSKQP